MSDATLTTSDIFTFPATIVQRATTAELLDAAKARAVDPAIFDEYQPFFWSSEISSNRLDSYFTHMQPSTLKNFANEAVEGRAFQDSHKTDSIARTLGYSLSGQFTGAGGNGIARTNADWYTLVGLDPFIDTFIRKVRGALIRDNSVGFFGGKLICSICNRDMYRDWECWHWPGFEYVVVEDGKKTDKRVLATGAYEDAHLSEVSAVYDGATPGAMITKAQRMIEAGHLKAEHIQTIEQRYRIHLPHTAPVHPVAVPQSKERPMDPAEDRTTPPADDPGQRAIATLASIRSVFGADATDDGVVARVQALHDENARLTPLARDGETFRKQRIERAITEGKRAYGADFDEAGKRTLLDKLPIDEIDERGDLWEERASLTFKGGRQTIDEDEREPPAASKGIPDKAYSTRGA